MDKVCRYKLCPKPDCPTDHVSINAETKVVEDRVKKLRDRFPIVELLKGFVELKPFGVHFKGNCPFEVNGDDNFIVSNKMQLFLCYCCKATGNIIDFLVRKCNISKEEAMDRLSSGRING